MSTQLDPVTGLPIVDSGFIDQIPLGVQVMPWDDLSATARPSRQPAYPDDILNTMAGVVGWRQDKPTVPQNVYTDGHHRLLVSSSSGGSNISSPWVVTEVNGMPGIITLPSGSQETSASIGYLSSDPIRALQIEVMPEFDGTPPAVWSTWNVGLNNNGANPQVSLITGQFYKTEWTNPSVSVARYMLENVIFDWASWGLIPGIATFYISANDGQVSMSVNYMLGH